MDIKMVRQGKFHGDKKYLENENDTDFNKFLKSLDYIISTPDPAEVVYCDHKTCKQWGELLQCYHDNCTKCKHYVPKDIRDRWFEREV